MNNHYLHIEDDYISYSDGVFNGFSKLEDDEKLRIVCLDRAEQFRTSELGNYDDLSQEQREELAKRWEAAKNLPDGKYEYYFNLEDKRKVFKQSVEELAKRLGISYELKLKGDNDE